MSGCTFPKILFTLSTATFPFCIFLKWLLLPGFAIFAGDSLGEQDLGAIYQLEHYIISLSKGKRGNWLAIMRIRICNDSSHNFSLILKSESKRWDFQAMGGVRREYFLKYINCISQVLRSYFQSWGKGRKVEMPIGNCEPGLRPEEGRREGGPGLVNRGRSDNHLP